MMPNQVRALALTLPLLTFVIAPILVSAIQDPPEPPQREQEGDESVPGAETAEPAGPTEGDSPAEPPARRPGLLPLSVIAEADLGSRAVGPALFHEQALIIATVGGEVLSLDATTLETRWKLGMPGAELFPPFLLPNAILVASRSGSFMLVRPETGEISTEKSIGPSLALPPVWEEPTLFLVTTDRQVMAYHLGDGKENWRSKLQDPPLAMTSGAGLLLVSDRSGGLHAFEAATGALRWQFQGRGNFEAAAAFDEAGERLYIGDTAGFFYSLSVREGKVRYRWSNGAAITDAALLDGDRVLVASYANTLFSYRAGNGHELWRANLPGRPAAAPFLARRRVVVLTLNGRVAEYALSGQPERQVYTAPEDVLPYPTLQRDRLALPLRSGKLLLLRTRQPAPAESEEPAEGEENLGEDPVEAEPGSPSATLRRTELS